MSGIAFEFGDASYTAPNRSTMARTEGVMKAGPDHGLKKQVQGYWLDILVGPFVAFGVDCDRRDTRANDLFHIVNKGTGAQQHRHHSVEVALYNVMGMMWELEVSLCCHYPGSRCVMRRNVRMVFAYA